MSCMSTSTTSPDWIKSGGFIPTPVPPGVPVSIMSPGERVNNLQYTQPKATYTLYIFIASIYLTLSEHIHIVLQSPISPLSLETPALHETHSFAFTHLLGF